MRVTGSGLRISPYCSKTNKTNSCYVDPDQDVIEEEKTDLAVRWNQATGNGKGHIEMNQVYIR